MKALCKAGRQQQSIGQQQYPSSSSSSRHNKQDVRIFWQHKEPLLCPSHAHLFCAVVCCAVLCRAVVCCAVL